MPITAPVWVRLSSVFTARAMPKSVTFTWPSSVISTFPGLMSRWITPVAVRVVERKRDVCCDLRRAVRVKGSGGSEYRRERTAVDELHDDEVRPVVLSPVEHRNDVRVREVGGRLRLAPEALDERSVDRQLGEEDLYGHRTVQEAVVSAVNLGHSAAGDQVDQLVSPRQGGSGAVGVHVCQSLRPRMIPAPAPQSGGLSSCSANIRRWLTSIPQRE